MSNDNTMPEGEVGKIESQHGNGAPDNGDLPARLKHGLETTRLPGNLREQILADLPSLEEQERLVRELQEKEGLSSKEFLGSLGLEVEPKS